MRITDSARLQQLAQQPRCLGEFVWVADVGGDFGEGGRDLGRGKVEEDLTEQKRNPFDNTYVCLMIMWTVL